MSRDMPGHYRDIIGTSGHPGQQRDTERDTPPPKGGGCPVPELWQVVVLPQAFYALSRPMQPGHLPGHKRDKCPAGTCPDVPSVPVPRFTNNRPTLTLRLPSTVTAFANRSVVGGAYEMPQGFAANARRSAGLSPCLGSSAWEGWCRSPVGARDGAGTSPALPRRRRTRWGSIVAGFGWQRAGLDGVQNDLVSQLTLPAEPILANVLHREVVNRGVELFQIPRGYLCILQGLLNCRQFLSAHLALLGSIHNERLAVFCEVRCAVGVGELLFVHVTRQLPMQRFANVIIHEVHRCIEVYRAAIYLHFGHLISPFRCQQYSDNDGWKSTTKYRHTNS